MPDVQAEILIEAAPDRVYALAKDVESLCEFLPNVERVTIKERTPERTVSEWVGLVPEFKRKLSWVEEDLWDDVSRSCRFRALSGDWDRYEGVWRFQAEGEKTRARLEISYEYNVPLIGPLIRKLLHKLVGRNAEETLEGLRKRVAESGGDGSQ